MWEKISKGYNFVIAIYRNDIKNYDLSSVNEFNDYLLMNNITNLGKEIYKCDVKYWFEQGYCDGYLITVKMNVVFRLSIARKYISA